MKRWMRWAAVVLLSCLTAACDEDPARKVQIVARPLSPAGIAQSAPEPVTAPAEKLKPPEETGGQQTASGDTAKPNTPPVAAPFGQNEGLWVMIAPSPSALPLRVIAAVVGSVSSLDGVPFRPFVKNKVPRRGSRITTRAVAAYPFRSG